MKFLLMRIALCMLLLALAGPGISATPGDAAAPGVEFRQVPHYLVDDKLRRYRGEWGTMRFPAGEGKVAYEGTWLRLHARTDRPGNPIFFVAGGPSISGIESMLQTVPDLEALLQLGDVVVVEQRGAGFTRPQLDCGQTWDLPLDRPASRQDFIAEARRQFTACRQDWEQAGVDLSVPNTRTYADDIARVADHLGYAQIRLLAHSYGTQIALDFLRRYGDRTERAALVGVMGPSDALRLPSSADRVFSDLAAHIAADPALAAAYPQPVSLAREAVARLRQHPLTVLVPGADGDESREVVIGEFTLRWHAVQMLGRRSDIGRLPLLLHSLAHGLHDLRNEDLLQTMARTALRDRRGPISRRSSAAHYLTTCASGVSPERLDRIRREDADSLFGFVLHVALPEACDAWNQEPLGDEYRAPITSDVPVLMVSGSLDVRTPVGQAETLMQGLGNSTHLLIRQAGHGDLFRHAAVNAKIIAFLDGAPVMSQEFEFDWPEVVLP